jgi:hypothetical protein
MGQRLVERFVPPMSQKPWLHRVRDNHAVPSTRLRSVQGRIRPPDKILGTSTGRQRCHADA